MHRHLGLGGDITDQLTSLVSEVNASQDDEVVIEGSPNTTYLSNGGDHIFTRQVRFVGNWATFTGSHRFMVVGHSDALISGVHFSQMLFGGVKGPLYEWCKLSVMAHMTKFGPTGTPFNIDDCEGVIVSDINVNNCKDSYFGLMQRCTGCVMSRFIGTRDPSETQNPTLGLEDKAGTNNQIIDNRFVGCRFQQAAIVSDGDLEPPVNRRTVGIKILRNTIEDCWGIGIRFQQGDDGEARHNVIRFSEDPSERGTHAFQVDGSDEESGHTIEENFALNPGNNFARIKGTASGITIARNGCLTPGKAFIKADSGADYEEIGNTWQ